MVGYQGERGIEDGFGEGYGGFGSDGVEEGVGDGKGIGGVGGWRRGGGRYCQKTSATRDLFRIDLRARRVGGVD